MLMVKEYNQLKPHRRLSKDVIPQNYNIMFNTNLGTFRFAGSETISVIVTREAKTIWINAATSKGLKVKKAIVVSGAHSQTARITKSGSNFVSLDLDREIKGPAKINIEFEGVNNDGMYGFYRSRYAFEGKEGHILTTQFEPCDARAAFPCFDEPEFKATFDISIETEADEDAISNMPVKEVVQIRERKLFVFETTPIMSTYLVYLGVGKFEYYNDRLGKVPIRVVTVPGKSRYAKMAADFAKKFIRYYEGYFGIKYMMPKLDLIAVPDFAAGAMENWGAIAFREVEILGGMGTSSVIYEQNIAETIAHELAHQWFGDLVTMKWWDDLWLNESFATFMSFKAMDSVYPEWKAMEQYTDDIVSIGLDADEFMTTHPVSEKTRSPGDVEGRIYEIVYFKGGAILAMIEDYVGPKVFGMGLNSYLKRYSYGNASKVDLWKEIQGTAKNCGEDYDIERIAETWISRSGHPIIKVGERHGNAFLEQERFLLFGNARSGTWPIPVHYLAKGGRKRTALMDRRVKELPVKAGDLIKLNYGQKGFYRVEYAKETLGRVGALIKAGRLEDIDVWGVESDLFALCRRGDVVIRDYLKFIDDYCMHCGYPADSNVLSHLYWLFRILYKTPLKKAVRDVGIDYAQGLIDRLGWKKRDGESSLSTMQRSATIATLGLMGDGRVTRIALDAFKNFVNNGKEIDVNIRGAVYSIAAVNGDKKTFDWFIKRFKAEKFSEEQRKLLHAIGLFVDPGLIKKALAFEMSGAVRTQDAWAISYSVATGIVGKELIWRWIRKNWKLLMKRHNESTEILTDFVKELSVVSDERELDEIIKFFGNKKNMRGDIKWDVPRTYERIKANINFLKRNGLYKVQS